MELVSEKSSGSLKNLKTRKALASEPKYPELFTLLPDSWGEYLMQIKNRTSITKFSARNTEQICLKLILDYKLRISELLDTFII